MAKHLLKSFKNLHTAEDQVSDFITGFVGSMNFVYVHSVWFILWALFNLGLLGTWFVFDSYPFGLLTLIVSLEAIFLSTFVMISQNKQSKMSDVRSELDYETDVKAEKEVELIMETLERIASDMHIDISDLSEEIKKLHMEEKELIAQEKKALD